MGIPADLVYSLTIVKRISIRQPLFFCLEFTVQLEVQQLCIGFPGVEVSQYKVLLSEALNRT